jgi:hypothetical protein
MPDRRLLIGIGSGLILLLLIALIFALWPQAPRVDSPVAGRPEIGPEDVFLPDPFRVKTEEIFYRKALHSWNHDMIKKYWQNFDQDVLDILVDELDLELESILPELEGF